ncbi:hypothetical protein [Oscillibacter sp. GMB15532]|uniref:hypothetical protein n=1 Tax=Oscillibacter sp. GMB15532 TaxID=3230022 RepID=UPI0034E054ED
MTELINVFRAKQENCNAESYQKLQALINSANDLMNTYINYQRNGVALTSASGATKVGIAAIVTYFNTQSCYLSAELLIHMEDNNKLDSIYIPEMVTALRQQSCWNTYRNGYPSSGSGTFSTKNSSQDLYYAIHLYNWTRNDSTKQITLSDRYDFDYNDRYDELAETATNFLALAQDRGEILPFYTTVYNL